MEEFQKEMAKFLSKRASRQFKRKSKSVHSQVFPSSDERKDAWISLLRETGGRDPQETFHSITQSLNISYQCHLEGPAGAEDVPENTP